MFIWTDELLRQATKSLLRMANDQDLASAKEKGCRPGSTLKIFDGGFPYFGFQ